MYLEKYLLSLYRKTFDERVSSLSTLNEIKRPDSSIHKRSLSDVPGDLFKSKEKSLVINSSSSLQTQDSMEKFVDSGIHRCHSSLSHSACNIKTSPPRGTLAEAVDSFHSLPLSMLEVSENFSCMLKFCTVSYYETPSNPLTTTRGIYQTNILKWCLHFFQRNQFPWYNYLMNCFHVKQFQGIQLFFSVNQPNAPVVMLLLLSLVALRINDIGQSHQYDML